MIGVVGYNALFYTFLHCAGSFRCPIDICNQDFSFRNIYTVFFISFVDFSMGDDPENCITQVGYFIFLHHFDS